MADKKINSLVLDTGGIIKNDPPVSVLLSQAEILYTVPAIISEIKDAATRARVETTLKPFLNLRSPTPNSIKVVTDFARRTGDLVVISKPDIQIIALTYELECERNGGDWRLRRVPGQKRVNGPSPASKAATCLDELAGVVKSTDQEVKDSEPDDSSELNIDGELGRGLSDVTLKLDGVTVSTEQSENDMREYKISSNAASAEEKPNSDPGPNITGDSENAISVSTLQEHTEDAEKTYEEALSSDSDSEGWVTSSNLKKNQARDTGAFTTEGAEPMIMQAAVLTTDFAMQNVILQMNLNLLSSSLSRVKQLKTFVLRCHGCFMVTKEMEKQFCPRCGQASLTRVSCSTNANGEFKLHLKRNMQWNHRGDRYSIPKPVHGSSNGRIKGGGKGGWGNDLILAEDQKEYQKAAAESRRSKQRDLMDDDYLPSILTGDRRKSGNQIRVGAGRTVNSKKR